MTELLNRFKEPSSYAGLTGLLAMVGVQMDPGLAQHIAGGLAAIVGILSVFLGEKAR